MPTSQLRCVFFKVVAAAALVVLSGCQADTPFAEDDESTRPVPVQTVSVSQQDVETTSLQPATVHAFYRAEIRAKVTGYVKTIEADIGDYVEKGSTLATIDVPEMDQQRLVIEARIALHTAKEAQALAGVTLAQATVRSAEAQLSQAKSELGRAEALLAAIEAEFTRTNDLVQRQSLESRLLDEVRKKRDSERANRQAMDSAIATAEAGVIVAEAQLSTAQAALSAAQAETTIAKRELDAFDAVRAYATITAPFAGVVTARTVDPGNLVHESRDIGSGQALFVISDVSRVRVHIAVPEADAPLVNHGDLVALQFPSFAAEPLLKTTVTRLSGDLDPSTRTMLVEAEISNPDGKLLPGMFGEAAITLGTQVAANVLPARAIRFSESGDAYVYIVGEDQTVTVAPVTTGIDTGRTIQVKSGVAAGQRVIDAHRKRFATGQKVAVISH